MIKETITAKTGQKDTIIEKSRYLIELTRLEPGYISYHLYASTENKDVLLMMEHWKNPEVLDTHIRNEHFKAFSAAIESILAEKLDTDIYPVVKKIF